MTETRSVVLVGFGLGGRVFHAPLIAATDGLRLDAIVTSDPGRRDQARAEYPDAAVYETVQEAWAGGHDLAAISTANVTHVPYARAALDSGMHVVLDKPIAPTATAARELGELARDRGRLLVPFQNRRWDSDFLTIASVVRSGRLGTIHRFESRIERMRVRPKGAWRDSTDPEAMGGVLFDLGAHVVDQALVLMGPVTTVSAVVRSLRGHSDDEVVIRLEHASGAVSILVVSLLGAFPGPRFTVLGTRGGVRVRASDSQEEALVAGRRPGPGWGREPDESAALLRLFDEDSVLTEERVSLEPGAWPRFYAEVSDAIAGSAPPPVALDDVIADLRVLDAARDSRGETIRMDPPAGHASSIV